MEVLGSGLFGIPYGGILDDCIVYPVRVFVKRKYLMGWMCWCHLRQGVPVYGQEYRCVCYSLHTPVIRQSPKLASAQTVGLVAETSLHLITQVSRVFLSIHGSSLPVS